jgi:hypothetical protein
MAAFFLCPRVNTYSSMAKYLEYMSTKDYNRGFAAFKADLKGSNARKACFDAAHKSGFFNVL